MKPNKEMRALRDATSDELFLIEYLAGKARYPLDANWKEHIKVVPLTEEQLGSVEITFDTEMPNPQESLEISNCMFYDRDGIAVAVYLLVNKENKLCELDVWKCDDTPIYKIPSVEKLMDIGFI